MKALVALASVGVLLAGVVFAVVRTSGGERPVNDGSENGPETSAAELGLLRAELRDLRAELAGLKAANEDLALRLASVEARPAVVQPRTPVAEAAPQMEEVRELVTALQQPDANAPQLETFVLDVLDQKEEREEAARRERREQARAERLDLRMGELTEALGLSPYQADEMRTILAGESARRDALITQMRESGDFDRRAMRESMETVRGEVHGALETVLTPEQLDAYQALDRGPGRGGPDGGGRRGGQQGRQGGSGGNRGGGRG